MLALEPFYSNIKKPKKSPSHGAVDESIDHHTHQGKGSSTMDDLMFLADTLHSCSLEPFKSKGSAGSISGYNDLISFCDKNPLSKALMVMHKASCTASLKGITGSEQQAQLMKESIELIQKAQQQDQKLLKCNKESKPVTDDTPPPPILLYRSPSIMVFKPAPFEPKNDQVAWYSLFARSANGNNIKVRLNDYQLPGTGEETPATSDCELIVKGLKPNQRYVFAVAAYNSKGQLIGKTIGSTSRSVLAAYSLPTLMAWGYLAQIAFSAGVPAISQQACAVLWNHFVIEPQPSEEELKIKNAENDLKVRLKVLDQSKIHSSSPVLVRQFVQSIFISVDLSIRDNFLYCNSLCDNGPLYNSQVARLRECERLLLAIQVAGWLNDAAMCLQAIVQVYGLLAPMVQQKIPAKPVVQVLLRCHAVLQEVPSLTRHRRQSSASDSLSHMIAAMTYFVAKILQSWEEKGLCGAIVELGKKMLNLETAPDSAGTMASMHQAAAIATANMVG
ncbi:Cilia- and flagella-associated protein 54, partial [Exaiptasia diaphana]